MKVMLKSYKEIVEELIKHNYQSSIGNLSKDNYYDIEYDKTYTSSEPEFRKDCYCLLELNNKYIYEKWLFYTQKEIHYKKFNNILDKELE